MSFPRRVPQFSPVVSHILKGLEIAKADDVTRQAAFQIMEYLMGFRATP